MDNNAKNKPIPNDDPIAISNGISSKPIPLAPL